MKPDSTMQAWMSIPQMAVAFGLGLDEARTLADRMDWPKAFKAHGTLVLVTLPT